VSTRSRANLWFRPVAPIANAVADGIEADVEFLTRMRPTFVPIEPQELYEETCRRMVRAMVKARLSTKWILTARILDPQFDERCREICPELAPLDPITTGELQKAVAHAQSYTIEEDEFIEIDGVMVRRLP
jgi:hypothetical protein